MSHRPGAKRYILLFCLMLLFVTAVAGCSSGASGSGETTAGSSTTVSASPSTSGSSTTSPPVTLGPVDKERANNATVVNQFIQYLGENVADNDPRLGILYGLRARTQALSCRKALDSGDTAMADSAMKEVYFTLNRGRNVASGSVATTLEGAYTTIKTLGNPSDAPDKAKQLMDTFIGQLQPLLDEAKAMVPESTTSTS
jgi:hypothetical protein